MQVISWQCVYVFLMIIIVNYIYSNKMIEHGLSMIQQIALVCKFFFM